MKRRERLDDDLAPIASFWENHTVSRLSSYERQAGSADPTVRSQARFDLTEELRAAEHLAFLAFRV
jgi:hypothetical protein